MNAVAEIQVGSDTPTTGEFMVMDGASMVGAVTAHPRLEGHWMAWVKPRGNQDSGLKKFKTRNGAVRFVCKQLAA